MKAILGCILFIGLVALLAFGMDRLEVSKTSFWPTIDGKLLDIQDRRFSMPIISRYVPISMPYAKYSYTVNGKTYVAEKSAGPCLSFVRLATFKAPEIIVPDHTAILQKLREGRTSQDFNKAMEVATLLAESREYKPIKIHYEANHPENSAPEADVLQSGASLWWTSILLIAVGGGALGLMYWHAYMTAPVENDPYLSLDAALAAQRSRSR